MKKINSAFLVLIMLFFGSLSSVSQNSVLSSGDWYKIATNETGIYKIGYDDLVGYGIDPASINPKHIRLYGNGNGMLPEENSEFRYEDLQENAIFVAGEDDGTFDAEDYILFYGEGPTKWKLDEETTTFKHQINYYSDATYYFLTTDLGEGKRIETQAQPAQPATFTKITADDYFFHEKDSINLLKAGRIWYGEEIAGNSFVGFNITLPFADLSSPINLEVSVAARTFEEGLFKIYIDNEEQKEFTISPVNSGSLVFAKSKTDTISFSIPADNFNLKIEFVASDTTSAWLDYFTINYKRALAYENGAFSFRCADVIGSGNITEFQISDVVPEINIWNVIDPINTKNVDFDLSGNTLSFKSETDNLPEFIAFDISETAPPEFIEQVANQNLHSLEPADIIIVTYDNYEDAAQQLADFHQENDNLSSVIVTPGQIYNEFSSGAQDIAAIRDFVKYLYDNNDSKPQYLLMFGSASYDYKDRIENNTNLAPVWETEYSLNLVSAYGTDDFYGWLDEDEGTSGIVDIGIGRIPAQNSSVAQNYVNKVIHYATSGTTLGNWKNKICFVADDGDNNLHLDHADSITTLIKTSSPTLNTTKTYLDFYELVSTPAGPRYPEVNESINSQVEEGRLLVNYTGHGSYNGWAMEQVLTTEDIESWSNFDNLPVFITATGDFAKFDNPEITAAGALLLEKENGGAIAVFSPVGLTYASLNFSFNKALIEFFVNSDQNRTLGNMQKFAKEAISTSNADKVWNLLGDPALKIAFPEYQISTETINGVSVTEPLDTINPGDQVNITGIVTDSEGNQVSDFDGYIQVNVFNKQYIKTTLGNTPQSPVVDIDVQDSVLLETVAAISNGEFEAQFTVPNNLDQEFGYLKLSYYATNGATDAAGNFSDILAGGEPAGVEEFAIESLFKVYPTIADDYISIAALQNFDNITTTLFDITGKPVGTKDYETVTKKQQIKLDISELTRGMYVLQIITPNRVFSYKIIKR